MKNHVSDKREYTLWYTTKCVESSWEALSRTPVLVSTVVPLPYGDGCRDVLTCFLEQDSRASTATMCMPRSFVPPNVDVVSDRWSLARLNEA